MADKNPPRTNVEKTYALLTGSKNTVVQTITNIVERPYRGEHAELRRAVEHDLKILKRLPPGEKKDVFENQLLDRALHLANKSKKDFFPKWVKRSFVSAVVIGVTLVVTVLGMAINKNHSLIMKGHPEYSFFDGWQEAILTLPDRRSITSRGNFLYPAGQMITLSGPDNMSNRRNPLTDYQFMLSKIAIVKSCDVGSPDTLPPPRNGQWILLDFEVHGLDGDVEGLDFLVRDSMFSAVEDGPMLGIGDSPAASCIAGLTNSGIISIGAHQIAHLKVLADVPSPHGYIGSKNFEWRY